MSDVHTVQGPELDTRKKRSRFSLKMQKVAMASIYPKIWPDYAITEVDLLPSALARQLDIGGCDKLLFSKDGHTVLVGQRFRTAKIWYNPQHRDFTIREVEYHRHMEALQNHGTIPGFYVYGYANETKDRFLQLFIVKYQEFMFAVSQGRLAPMQLMQLNGQEDFYFKPWAVIPDDYIFFRLKP